MIYLQGSREPRSPKSPLVDVPGEAGVRNIKSMWEKGNVQSFPTSPAAAPPKAECKVNERQEGGGGKGQGAG